MPRHSLTVLLGGRGPVAPARPRAKYLSRTIAQQIDWLPREVRLAIYLRDGCACVYCGVSVEEGVRLALDHVVPCDLFGSDEPSNLVTCCTVCNSSKRNLTLRTYVQHLSDYGRNTEDMQRRVEAALARPLPLQAARRMLKRRG